MPFFCGFPPKTSEKRDVKTYNCDDVYDVCDALLHQNDEKSIASVQSLCERFLSSVSSAFVFL